MRNQTQTDPHNQMAQFRAKVQRHPRTTDNKQNANSEMCEPQNKRATTNVTTRHNFKAWQPQNGKVYVVLLDKYIIEECNKPDWQSKDNSEKIEMIENTIMKVAMSCEKPTTKNIELPKVSDTMLRTALAGRSWYRQQHKYKEVSIMARTAQRLAKKLQRENLRIKVNRIVEDFKGFKWVPQIKRGGRKLNPCYMQHFKGTRETLQKAWPTCSATFTKTSTQQKNKLTGDLHSKRDRAKNGYRTFPSKKSTQHWRNSKRANAKTQEGWPLNYSNTQASQQGNYLPTRVLKL